MKKINTFAEYMADNDRVTEEERQKIQFEVMKENKEGRIISTSSISALKEESTNGFYCMGPRTGRGPEVLTRPRCGSP